MWWWDEQSCQKTNQRRSTFRCMRPLSDQSQEWGVTPSCWINEQITLKFWATTNGLQPRSTAVAPSTCGPPVLRQHPLPTSSGAVYQWAPLVESKSCPNSLLLLLFTVANLPKPQTVCAQHFVCSIGQSVLCGSAKVNCVFKNMDFYAYFKSKYTTPQFSVLRCGWYTMSPKSSTVTFTRHLCNAWNLQIHQLAAPKTLAIIIVHECPKSHLQVNA